MVAPVAEIVAVAETAAGGSVAESAALSLPHAALPGPKMRALEPFYRNWRWTGTIEAGGMGPGSPLMHGTGHATCRLIQDGLWYACDFQQDQHLADGTFVLAWRLHWVTGWDAAACEYRAASADNNGPTLAIYRGVLNGNALVYEPLGDALPRIRLTWLLDDDTHARWRNEITLDGSTWSLIEEYAMECEP
jgi:hypothetical protein